jgi:hypothetical protein
MEEKKYWIIMADIIKSTDNQSIETQNNFKSLVNILNVKFKKKLLSPLTITLGDEFQGIANRLKNSILIIIYLEELLIHNQSNLALRYVINHGKIDTPINHEIAHGMLGSGLSNARKTLESLKKTDKKFDINTQINTKDLALNEAFLIYQNLVSKWNSKNEREIASLFIQYQDYKVVAEKVGVNRSQIWKKERSLNISSYFAIKNVIAYLSR